MPRASIILFIITATAIVGIGSLMLMVLVTWCWWCLVIMWCLWQIWTRRRRRWGCPGRAPASQPQDPWDVLSLSASFLSLGTPPPPPSCPPCEHHPLLLLTTLPPPPSSLSCVLPLIPLPYPSLLKKKLLTTPLYHPLLFYRWWGISTVSRLIWLEFLGIWKKCWSFQFTAQWFAWW